MTVQVVNSAIHFAAWFIQRAAKSRRELSNIELQNMLFLAQLHYGITNGGTLIPSMFVCYRNGFYEPNVKQALKFNLSLETGKFQNEELEVLENVWNKYSSLTEDEILTQVWALSLWKNNYRQNNEVIVNPLEYTPRKSLRLSSARSENKAKIRLSQNGPVEVSPWCPRKVNKKK